MLDRLEAVRRYYTSTADDYRYFWSNKPELAMHFGYYDDSANSHQASLQRMNQKLADLVKISAGNSVLDMGCGSGTSAFWLARHYNCNVSGITIVEREYEQAVKRARREGMEDRLTFKLLDYNNSKLADGSFDVVWCLESLVHSVDKARAVREAYRLLKPGGRLIIAEYMVSEGLPSEKDKEQLEYWLKAWEMPNLNSHKQYLSQLETSDFKNVKTYDISSSVEPSLKYLNKKSGQYLPLVNKLAKLHLISDRRLKNISANNIIYKLFKARVWRYQVVVGKKA